MDFQHSPRALEYLAKVGEMIEKRIRPAEALYFEQLVGSNDYRQWRIPKVMDELKAEAKAAGLWNLFLPDKRWGAGLDNRDYAPIAELMGASFIAPEVFNCNAPDTGNMEVLVHYGSPEQQERWLKPLLDGTIRSGFAMTEPDVASSDATNMQARAEIQGDEVVVNGRKWWTTGAGDPRCKFVIFMGVTFPDAQRHVRHSMVLVPLDAKGVTIERMLPVFGHLDEPNGHAQLRFDDVRLPLSALIAGPGAGSRSRRAGSDRGASITACAASARPSARCSGCASARSRAWHSASRS
jgi:alkylation response protein AidB-like acyl-CoA dehydrogenase